MGRVGHHRRSSLVARFTRWCVVFASLLAGSLSAVDLPNGFLAETLCDGINAATCMAVSPDGRIFIGEQTGTLRLVKNGRLMTAPVLTVTVDDYWERGLLGVTLDRAFPAQPFLYVVYVAPQPYPHHVVSRFTLEGDAVKPGSELLLLEGDDQRKLGGNVPAGHQGGPIRFGADGKLYVGLGEQTAGKPSQELTTLQGKLLRLNPDGSIPADNPFYHSTTNKYRAIWAYGLRNPFGLAVQPGTGRMFFTDVGASAWEEVNEVERSANYGWPLAEGMSTDPRFKNPIHTYPPMVGRSITGGAFYPRETELRQVATPFPGRWCGKLFFLDYMNNWLKALDPDSPTNVVTFARNLNGPVAVEAAPDGSLLVLNRGAWVRDKKFADNTGTLLRIRFAGEDAVAARPGAIPNPNPLNLPGSAAELPKRWALLGIDDALPPLIARRQCFAYQINCPEWQPGVYVERRIVLPPGGKIQISLDGDWQFPPGTVFLRNYSVLSGGAPRVFERRLMVIGATRSYGAAYKMSPTGSDGELVEDGELIDLTPYGARGKSHLWFVPPIEDGLTFPTANLAYTLDANTRQLNRNAPDGRNQLETWDRAGWFEMPLGVINPATLPRLADVRDTSASAELRVRSYLDVNCAICHRPGGASRGLFDARFTTALNQAGMLKGQLAAGDLGIPDARVIVPGNPDKSVMFQRLKRNDFFRMPPVQFHNEPSPILSAMEEWIRSLPAE